MLSKIVVGLAAALTFSAASMEAAISGSNKTRPAKHTRTPPPAPYPGTYALPPGPHSWSYGLRLRSTNPAHDVYVGGEYAGSDPDPRIRAMIINDPPWKHDGP